MSCRGRAQPVSHEENSADGRVETVGPDKDSYSSSMGKVTTSPRQGHK